ncbi:hypothetical protein [Streptomyces sp. URMC 123]|uniref:hypothetical protein n=1 Tax=Streptomyces sp. URMC 123 TaxID=3423403 RepID=UPI003F1D97DD
MSIPADPTEPETFEAEADLVDAGVTDVDIEAPEGDIAEQHLDVDPEEENVPPVEPPLEADPADAVEQTRVVPLSEDDYR